MSFPRGSIDNEKVSAQRADPDTLFGGSARLARVETSLGGKKAAGKRSKSDEVEAIEMGLNARIGLGMVKTLSSKELKVDPVSFTKYQPGAQALGFVLQLSGSKAIVSLPGGCVGTIQLEEVSDVAASIMKNAKGDNIHKTRRGKGGQSSALSIENLLSLHQPVRVHVLGQIENKGGKKKDLALSMRSSHFNRHLQLKNLGEGFSISGCIASKEDHGYVVSTGVPNTSFFMPTKNVPASMGQLLPGRYSQTLFTILWPSLALPCYDD
jgi:rRNA biogenesis protein RRP5